VGDGAAAINKKRKGWKMQESFVTTTVLLDASLSQDDY
jgi:hypothetical protein